MLRPLEETAVSSVPAVSDDDLLGAFGFSEPAPASAHTATPAPSRASGNIAGSIEDLLFCNGDGNAGNQGGATTCSAHQLSSQVRKTPYRPRNRANFSPLSLYSYRNT